VRSGCGEEQRPFRRATVSSCASRVQVFSPVTPFFPPGPDHEDAIAMQRPTRDRPLPLFAVTPIVPDGSLCRANAEPATSGVTYRRAHFTCRRAWSDRDLGADPQPAYCRTALLYLGKRRRTRTARPSRRRTEAMLVQPGADCKPARRGSFGRAGSPTYQPRAPGASR